ncbi:MAG: autotransporter-associated beta strand repeat-containing protein [Planctomycetes bacterium]|nr:autotransporter-associated beta strand repeat-containing protein [Planctomycetota bacterium]
MTNFQQVSRRTAIVISLAALLFLSPAACAVEFFFIYDDAAGTGFLDPVLGQQRRDALAFGADIWGRLIRSAYEGETIHVHAKYESYPPGSNTLAQAGPNFYYSDFGSSNPAYVIDTNYPKALANHLNGGDLNAARHEINLQVNNAKNFYYGVDGMPPANQYDFVTLVAHEIGHGLGFTSSIQQDGDFGVLGDGSHTDPVCPGCLPNPYDRFLWLSPPGGAPIISLTDSGREAAVISNNVFWNGPAGVQGNGGTAPKILATNPWDDSSLSHLDDTTFPNAMMNSAVGTGQVQQTPTAFERGMLRDMGWTISVASQQITWTGAGGNNSATTAGNWSPILPLPGDNLMFDNPGAAGSDINMDLTLYSVGEIRFASTAPDYILRFKPWTDTHLTGAGVVRESAGTQTIFLESRPGPNTGTGQVYDGSAAIMNFKNGAGAGNGTYELGGGDTGLHSNPPLPPIFNRTSGASMTFESILSTDSSSAETATINIEGGSGNGGFGAQVTFKGTSTAGDAEFWVKAGRRGISLPFPSEIAGNGARVRFESTSSANTAHFRNDGLDYNGGTGGATQFFETAHAFQAVFDNYGSPTSWNGAAPLPGGRTEFFDNSVAESGVFNNHPGLGQGALGAGITAFYEDSTADHGTFNNKGAVPGLQYGGATEFHDRATAGNATFHNEVANGVARIPGTAGHTRFYDNSTAANATFHNKRGGGSTFFYDSSTAGDGHFFIEDAGSAFEGYVGFYGNSKGGTADFTIKPLCFACSVFFRDTSNAEHAEIKTEDGSEASAGFWNSASMGHANIDIGYRGGLSVRDQATADHATIRLRAGGGADFTGLSTTAANSTITIDGGSVPGGGGGALFMTGANAGNATINVNGGTVPGAGGGQVHFGSGANAGTATLNIGSGVAGAGGGGANLAGDTIATNARFTVAAGGFVSLTTTVGTVEIGSIEGAGAIHLGHVHLRTGGLNTSTTISGPITGFATNPRLTKIGTGTLTLAGTNTYNGLTKVDGGTLVINGSTPGSVEVNNSATLKGIGTIGGTVTVNAGGVYSPGTSPGTMTVGGLAMTPGGTLDFELGDPARDHIAITNNGNLSLAGTLNLSLIGGFTPTLGQTFTLFEGAIGSVTGGFSSIVAPIFDGHTFGVTYSASSALLEVVLAGDFNLDGTVDAADYVAWRKGIGVASTPANYNLWRTHFGQTAGSGSGATGPSGPSSANPAIPEPTSLVLLLLAAAALFVVRRTPFSPLCPGLATAPHPHVSPSPLLLVSPSPEGRPKIVAEIGRPMCYGRVCLSARDL